MKEFIEVVSLCRAYKAVVVVLFERPIKKFVEVVSLYRPYKAASPF